MVSNSWKQGLTILFSIMVLAGCATNPIETVVVSQVATPRTVTQVVEVTAEPPTSTLAPTAEPLHELIVCMLEEPDTLYPLLSNMAATRTIWQAADARGWLPDRGYFYETQMLVNDEFPSFENGDAVIEGEGDEAILSVTFRYKPEIVWSDGEPFTVDDILFTREVVLNPNWGTPIRDMFEQPEFIKINDHTLTIKYPRGVLNPTYFLPPFSTVHGVSPPLPKHVLGELTPNEIIDSEYFELPNPVLGPYRFVAWIKGERVVMEANPHYWGDRPHMERLEFLFIPDSARLLATVLSGECDLAIRESSYWHFIIFVPHYNRDLVRFEPVFTTVWEHIDFNTCPPPTAENGGFAFFADKRVRHAISYGTNRRMMTEQILFGEVEPLNSYLPPDHWAWNPRTDGAYEYDPDRARELLEEAGWIDLNGDGIREAAYDLVVDCGCGRGERVIPAGTPFEVNFHTTEGNAMREQLATIFQANMLDIGIQVNLGLLPASEWFANDGLLFTRNFQLGEFAWISDPDPDAIFLYAGINLYRTAEGEIVNALDLWSQAESELRALGIDEQTLAFGRWSDRDAGYVLVQNEQIPHAADDYEGGNNSGWCHPEATELLYKGNQRIDSDARRPFYQSFQSILMEEVPMLPLFPRLDVVAHRPELCGLDLGPANFDTWNIEDWYFDEACVDE